MKTLQDRIRERAYHLLNDWCGQGDDNHYRLKERAVGTAGGSWLLAEIAAESLLASASAETAAPRKARGSTKSSSRTQAELTRAASIKTRARAAGR